MPNKTLAVTPGSGTLINTLPDVGQQAKADSLPVVLASNSDALPISAAQLPSTIGQKAATNSLSVVLASNSDALPTVNAAGEAHIGEIGGNSTIAVTNFTRPADTTAYAIGDLVANSTSAGSVAALSLSVARKAAGTGRITRARLTKSGTSITGAVFRAHLYKTAPTLSALQDNAALLTDGALAYLGSLDFDMTGASARVFTDGVKAIAAPNVGAFITFDAAAGSQAIFALIEARGAYTPASAETFTLALEADRD